MTFFTRIWCVIKYKTFLISKGVCQTQPFIGEEIYEKSQLKILRGNISFAAGYRDTAACAARNLVGQSDGGGCSFGSIAGVKYFPASAVERRNAIGLPTVFEMAYSYNV